MAQVAVPAAFSPDRINETWWTFGFLITKGLKSFPIVTLFCRLAKL
jgi:hypothetical protein